MAVASTDIFKLGFIGAGNMAESIARGVSKSGVLPASSIRTAHPRPQRQQLFQSFGVSIVEDNAQVLFLFLLLLPWSIGYKRVLGLEVRPVILCFVVFDLPLSTRADKKSFSPNSSIMASSCPKKDCRRPSLFLPFLPCRRLLAAAVVAAESPASLALNRAFLPLHLHHRRCQLSNPALPFLLPTALLNLFPAAAAIVAPLQSPPTYLFPATSSANRRLALLLNRCRQPPFSIGSDISRSPRCLPTTCRTQHPLPCRTNALRPLPPLQPYCCCLLPLEPIVDAPAVPLLVAPYHSLNLLFFIVVGQPLPSSLAASVAPPLPAASLPVPCLLFSARRLRLFPSAIATIFLFLLCPSAPSRIFPLKPLPLPCRPCFLLCRCFRCPSAACSPCAASPSPAMCRSRSRFQSRPTATAAPPCYHRCPQHLQPAFRHIGDSYMDNLVATNSYHIYDANSCP
ncbi:hypothetical protein B296_00011244 [Ensete ventricosum]|uniref:Pyrroline-5-carboxylate reductase catalytic N-terminal domain-containing protein n=1 Tax=Ensete ventricosum TaxID=4639 RepID=A0A427AKF7_ENSVE|nr:hypothetical protein B296_00011244 [Ensete ventricosum]